MLGKLQPVGKAAEVEPGTSVAVGAALRDGAAVAAAVGAAAELCRSFACAAAVAAAIRSSLSLGSLYACAKCLSVISPSAGMMVRCGGGGESDSSALSASRRSLWVLRLRLFSSSASSRLIAALSCFFTLAIALSFVSVCTSAGVGLGHCESGAANLW